MFTMFSGATAFDNNGQSLNTSGNKWNTSNVTNMDTMFQGTTKFNKNIGSSSPIFFILFSNSTKDKFIMNLGIVGVHVQFEPLRSFSINFHLSV